MSVYATPVPHEADYTGRVGASGCISAMFLQVVIHTLYHSSKVILLVTTFICFSSSYCASRSFLLYCCMFLHKSSVFFAKTIDKSVPDTARLYVGKCLSLILSPLMILPILYSFSMVNQKGIARCTHSISQQYPCFQSIQPFCPAICPACFLSAYHRFPIRTPNPFLPLTSSLAFVSPIPR